MDEERTARVAYKHVTGNNECDVARAKAWCVRLHFAGTVEKPSSSTEAGIATVANGLLRASAPSASVTAHKERKRTVAVSGLAAGCRRALVCGSSNQHGRGAAGGGDHGRGGVLPQRLEGGGLAKPSRSG